MAEQDINIGQQAEQREIKGFSKVTEVQIPLLQAFWTMIGVDLLAVLALAAAIVLGPIAWQVVLGLLLGGVTLGLVINAQESKTWPAWLVIGATAITATEAGLVSLKDTWPYHWLTLTGCLEAWPILFVGPATGAALLVRRFINELEDPFANKPGREQPEPLGRPRAIKETHRPVFVRSWLEQPQPPKPEPITIEQDTLYEDIYELMVEAYRIRGLKRARWSGEHQFMFSDGRRLSKSRFKELVGYLIQAGIATWNGPGTAKQLAVSIEQAMHAWNLTEFWESNGRPGENTFTGRAGGTTGGPETGGATARSWTGME